MNQNETNTIILRFCGYDFLHYTYTGNAVNKLHFVDADFTYFEFETSGGSALNYKLSNLKKGAFYRVSWKRYGNTWKKIAYAIEPTETGAEENEK